MAGSSEQLVWLRGGLVTPVEPLRLLWRLEAEGFVFRLSENGVAEVSPFAQLSPDDLSALRRWHQHVALLIGYVADDSHLVGADTPRAAAARTA